MPTLTCATCGAMFHRRPSVVNAGANYCTTACADRAKVTRITLACAQCGVTFARVQAMVIRSPIHYCSSACCGAAQRGAVSPLTGIQVRPRIDVVCATCGATFKRLPSVLRRAMHHYCSRACQSRGHRAEHNPGWKGDQATLQAAHARAQRLFASQPCDVCGRPPYLIRIDRHHIDRNPLNNDPVNVRLLCAPCHARLHHEEKIC